jgi:hypothetical protein
VFHSNADPDPAFHFNADPVMGTCEYWSVDPPGLHFEPLGLHSRGLHGSVFESLKLLNFDFNADPGPAFQLNVNLDPDPAFHSNADPESGFSFSLKDPMMGSCDYWSVDPQGLHFEPPGLYPRDSLCFEPLKLLNFDFKADPDASFNSKAGSGSSFQK